MEAREIFGVLLGGLAGSAPSLVIWITVLVVSIIVMRRRGGKAERFLVIGAGIGIIAALLYIPSVLLVPLLITEGTTTEYAMGFVNTFSIIRSVVSAAGLICFIYAFWVKFNTGRAAPEVTTETDEQPIDA
jgi:hypothetical protein